MGIIKGSESLIDPNSVGYETCAYIGFFINDTSKFDEIVSKLRDIPEVVECHLTTGKYDLLIKLFAKNNNHLLRIIQSKIQTLGLARTETLISFQEVFRRQIPINDNESED
jgi:Lrp/AsnC family transcriptional regulator for asnA, asnC and gidA